jgi:hypothetical protein
VALVNAYATLADVKRNLSITDSVDDALLELCITSASRAIDNMTERTFFQTEETRVFVPDDSFFCPIDDLYTLTTLKTADDADQEFDITWGVKDKQLEPLNGTINGTEWPYTGIRAVGDYLFPTVGSEATVQVTGVFGWPSVPTAIEQATILQAARYFKRSDSPMGVAGFDAMGVVRLSNVDPDIYTLLEPYKKIRMY